MLIRTHTKKFWLLSVSQDKRALSIRNISALHPAQLLITWTLLGIRTTEGKRKRLWGGFLIFGVRWAGYWGRRERLQLRRKNRNNFPQAKTPTVENGNEISTAAWICLGNKSMEGRSVLSRIHAFFLFYFVGVSGYNTFKMFWNLNLSMYCYLFNLCF